MREAQAIADAKGVAFTNGTRVLFLMQRNKEGGHTNNTKLEKVIVHNYAQYTYELAKLLLYKEKAAEGGVTLRIYASVNQRNHNKAMWTFRQRQLDVGKQGIEQEYYFYRNVHAEMVSALMLPANRLTSMFLLDIDHTDDPTEVLTALTENIKHVNGVKVVALMHTYKTKNGCHVITTPFNPQALNSLHGKVDLHKDGLMLLAY